MRVSLPTLYELPSVRAALKWLLRANGATNDRTILIRARVSRLVHSNAHGQWSANGDMAMRLANTAMRQLPNDPAQLGDVLHGLGEIAARSEAAFIGPLVRHLRPRRGRLNLNKVLAAAFTRDSEIRHLPRFDTIALAQWLSHAPLNWETFNQAVQRMEHGEGLIGSGRYGLRLTVIVTLALDPRIIDYWIKGHPDQQALAVVANAAMSMAFPFGGKPMIAPLLHSRNAAIRCLAAAPIVLPMNSTRSRPIFRTCHGALVTGGFEPADATWMMGMQIKRAIHERYGLEHQRRQDAARLRYLEKNPDAAMGGPQNAPAELCMLRKRLDHNDKRYQDLLTELEAMLCDMAATWPADGLSDAQMDSLEHIFVDTPEMRHRLAARLPHQGNRDWLLRKNIERLSDFIGLKRDPADIPTHHFYADETRFAQHAKWTTQSLLLLYETDSRGAGKRTSDLVTGLAKAADALAAQPFIAARKPEAWQSIIARAACADRFALAVVGTVTEGRRYSVARLNELAIAHAFALLSVRPPPVNALSNFHELTTAAIEQMEFLRAPNHVREQWGLASSLPDFARALALWSSPELTTQHRSLAAALFKQVGALPLSQDERALQMSRMLTLLDRAIASSAASGRTDLISEIKELWTGAYSDWHMIAGAYAGAAATLANAIAGDGPDRAQLLADADFAQSRCRGLIDPPSPKTTHDEFVMKRIMPAAC